MNIVDPLAARLADVGQILIGLAASPVPTHLLQTLAEHAGTAVTCDHFAIALRDPDGDGYVVHTLAGFAVGQVAPRRLPIDEGLPGVVMRQRRAMTVADLSALPDACSDIEREWMGLGLRTALIVPVHRGGDALGALVFARSGPDDFSAADEAIAAMLGAGLAGALEASQSYQVLADERTTLAAVVESMQDAVLVVNPEGLVLLANPAVRGMVGIEPEAVTGRAVTAVLEESPLRNALVEGRPGWTELSLPDGRTAEASVVPVRTPYGETVGFAAILRDVSALKQLVEMKTQLVNVVSHDLKNPLTVVLSASEMLRGDLAEGTRAAKRCEMIRKSATYMQSLVKDLLDLGAIEAKVEATDDPVDLAALLGDVVAGLEPQAEAKGVTLTLALPVGSATITGRPGRLQQALINVIGNAVKYTPSGGRATVALEEASGGAATVNVVVRDTGVGIPAAALPRVFDRFYRVRGAATRAIEGTGLGLSIVKSIVEAHGGTISAESEEGKGSTFTLSFPARPA
jgi:PAS domain S-box-containing protein